MYTVETCIFDEIDYLPYCFRSLDDALAIAEKTMQKQCKAHQKLMEKDEEAKAKLSLKSTITVLKTIRRAERSAI